MDTLAIFGIQVVLSLVVYTLIAKWYVSPWLDAKQINPALMLLILPHTLRHLGLTFFVPGVVAEPLPTYFTNTVAYGDLVSGLLALLCLVALRREWTFALSLVWIFNIIGTADLLHAMVQEGAVPKFGATWFIPTFWVPLLLVAHVMIFTRLLKQRR